MSQSRYPAYFHFNMRSLLSSFLIISGSFASVTHFASQSKQVVRHGGHVEEKSESVNYHQEGSSAHMKKEHKTTIDGKVVSQGKDECDGVECLEKTQQLEAIDDE